MVRVSLNATSKLADYIAAGYKQLKNSNTYISPQFINNEKNIQTNLAKFDANGNVVKIIKRTCDCDPHRRRTTMSVLDMKTGLEIQRVWGENYVDFNHRYQGKSWINNTVFYNPKTGVVERIDQDNGTVRKVYDFNRGRMAEANLNTQTNKEFNSGKRPEPFNINGLVSRYNLI